MKFLVLLAFASIAIFGGAKAQKCPKDFELFQRKPTATNNHTAHYCLNVIFTNHTFNFDMAATLCVDFNSTLAIVENEKEWKYATDGAKAAAKYYHLNRTSIVVDGKFNPECKDYSSKKVRKYGGDCNEFKKLFLFQTSNTDHQYLFTRLNSPVPQAYGESYNGPTKHPISRRRWNAECLELTTELNINGTNLYNVECQYGKRESYMGIGDKPGAVLCGTLPL